MPELVTIPRSQFEYVAEFERPIIALWLERAVMVQAVFDALAPWNASVDNVEARNEGKPAEQGLLIRLPNQHAAFFFGPAKCRFTKDAAGWDEADEIIKMLDAARSALLKSSEAIVKIQRTSISLHLQPKKLAFIDLLAPFLPTSVLTLHPGKARTGALVVRWENAAITLDGSAVLANGVYLKLEREFDGQAGYDQIADALRTDELAALQLLNVEEDRN